MKIFLQKCFKYFCPIWANTQSSLSPSENSQNTRCVFGAFQSQPPWRLPVFHPGLTEMFSSGLRRLHRDSRSKRSSLVAWSSTKLARTSQRNPPNLRNKPAPSRPVWRLPKAANKSGKFAMPTWRRASRVRKIQLGRPGLGRRPRPAPSALSGESPPCPSPPPSGTRRSFTLPAAVKHQRDQLVLSDDLPRLHDDVASVQQLLRQGQLCWCGRLALSNLQHLWYQVWLS